MSISCSIGIALYPDNGRPTKLIARPTPRCTRPSARAARLLLLHTDDSRTDAKETFDLLRDLRRRSTSDELELFYQPKIDAKRARSRPRRRCCAGTIPRAGWCRRQCSFRWRSASA